MLPRLEEVLRWSYGKVVREVTIAVMDDTLKMTLTSIQALLPRYARGMHVAAIVASAIQADMPPRSH